VPNFTPIGEVPAEKTVTEQKTVNLVSHTYSVWRDNKNYEMLLDEFVVTPTHTTLAHCPLNTG